MLLKDYVKQKKIDVKELARLVNTSRTYMYHVFNGRRKLNLERARQIEVITQGMVSRIEALYPEDFEEDTACGKQLLMSITPRSN